MLAVMMQAYIPAVTSDHGGMLPGLPDLLITVDDPELLKGMLVDGRPPVIPARPAGPRRA